MFIELDNTITNHSINILEKICIHSIIKLECKKCKYKCIHNRQKSQCKKCGGASICIHNRLKPQCKECGGSSICIHNRQKSHCKDCCGSGICEHGRQKSQCKKCGGASICIHNKFKSKCKECGGGAFCEHGKFKSQCKECGGSSICIHNRQKSHCKECGGSSICEHNRRKTQCKDCGGSEICEHHRLKPQCKECGGGSICEHGKFKSQCKKCGGSQLCKSTFCETHKNKNKKYNGYCTRCYIHLFPNEPISRNYKTKEYAVLEFIRNNYPEHTWVNDKAIDGGCSKKRPDIFLDLLTHNIIIEIDENQHRSYDNCELKRINLLFEDLGDRHIVFIRFNPDDYLDKDNKKFTSCWGIDRRNGLSSVKKSKGTEWEQRLNTLKNVVDGVLCIDNIEITNPITYINLFYDEIN
jgi:hypothetical protein